MDASCQRVDGDRIWRWDGADDEAVALVRAALDAGACAQGERVGAAAVWLLADRVLKLQHAPRGPLRPWRPSRLRRAARGHAALGELTTPRPLVLVERRGAAGRLQGAGLLMTRLAGVDMRRAWGDPAAREALAPVLVALVARGAIHGDIHPGNLLWDGTRWGVIDLDSLRHRLHGLVRRRNWLRMWGCLLTQIEDVPGMGAVHAEACRLAGHRDVERRWRTILARSAAERRRRGWPPLSDRPGPGA